MIKDDLPVGPPAPGAWRDLGLCIGSSGIDWFPESDTDTPAGDPEPARSLCHQCVVMSECRNYAVTWDIADGVWGGMTSDERGHPQRKFKGTQSSAQQSRLALVPNLSSCPGCRSTAAVVNWDVRNLRCTDCHINYPAPLR
jgi:WhiB family redox-sensing transcriptional regulator